MDEKFMRIVFISVKGYLSRWWYYRIFSSLIFNSFDVLLPILQRMNAQEGDQIKLDNTNLEIHAVYSLHYI